MRIFTRNKSYSLPEIIEICDKNGLITVDCLKDEGMVSVEEEGIDCLFEFNQIREGIFRLTWQEDNLDLMPRKYR